MSDPRLYWYCKFNNLHRLWRWLSQNCLTSKLNSFFFFRKDAAARSAAMSASNSRSCARFSTLDPPGNAKRSASDRPSSDAPDSPTGETRFCTLVFAWFGDHLRNPCLFHASVATFRFRNGNNGLRSCELTDREIAKLSTRIDFDAASVSFDSNGFYWLSIKL